MRSRAIIFLSVFISLFELSCRKDAVQKAEDIKPVDFLSSSNYDKLEIEIFHINGYSPQTNSAEHLKNFLNARLNKPGGISILYTSIPSPGNSSYSVEQIQLIEKQNRRSFPEKKKLSAFFFFADAPYAGNSGSSQVLGIAYAPTSMAIFQKTIIENTGGVGEPSRYVLESTVMEHEFGHILGLVNNGTPLVTSHIDAAHGHHCNNNNCLMYYTAETTDILSVLVGGNIPALDAACIGDLQGNGGK
jgi:predicted Zn-dependent protease